MQHLGEWCRMSMRPVESSGKRHQLSRPPPLSPFSTMALQQTASIAAAKAAAAVRAAPIHFRFVDSLQSRFPCSTRCLRFPAELVAVPSGTSRRDASKFAPLHAQTECSAIKHPVEAHARNILSA